MDDGTERSDARYHKNAFRSSGGDFYSRARSDGAPVDGLDRYVVYGVLGSLGRQLCRESHARLQRTRWMVAGSVHPGDSNRQTYGQRSSDHAAHAMAGILEHDG